MMRRQLLFVLAAICAAAIKAGEPDSSQLEPRSSDPVNSKAFEATRSVVPVFGSKDHICALEISIDMPRRIGPFTPDWKPPDVRLRITNPSSKWPIAVFIDDDQIALFVHLVGVSYFAVLEGTLPNSNEMIIDIGPLLRRDYGASDIFVFQPKQSVDFVVNCEPVLKRHNSPGDLLCIYGELHAINARGLDPGNTLIFRPGVVRSEWIQVKIWDPS